MALTGPSSDRKPDQYSCLKPDLTAPLFGSARGPACGPGEAALSNARVHELDSSDALPDVVMRTAFLDAPGAQLSGAFPRRPDGVDPMPFPRLFLGAWKR